MYKLSQILRHVRKAPNWPEYLKRSKSSIYSAARDIFAPLIAPQLDEGFAVNMGLLFAFWWQGPRTIWQVGAETASLVSNTGMGFALSESPPAWRGEAIIIESSSRKPLIDDFLAVGCYRYFYEKPPGFCLVAIRLDGSGFQWAIPDYQKHEATREHKEGMRLYRWVMTFSMFVGTPGPWWKVIPAGDGPPLSDRNGKKLKKKDGSPATLWSYRSLVIHEPPVEPGPPRGPLDKSGLALRPTWVRPHWRRVGKAKTPKLIGFYSSSRWRRK